MLRFSKSLLLIALLSACLTGWAQGPSANDAEKAISTKMGGLRKLADSDRPMATTQLAMDIRALPAGERKVALANGLANLSTEGDFGHDTLQEVATTLAEALKETPVHPSGNEPAAPYLELAQLERYEHVSVTLGDPSFAAAKATVAALEKIRAAADFTLTDLQGKKWTRSALRGKVVLVNFWATWCPPCRKEMPDLNALYNRFKDQGFVILAISNEDVSKVQPYMDKHPYDYTILLDPGNKVNEQFQIDGIPKSFIYDRNGKLVAQSIDMRTQRQFLEMLGHAGLK